MRTVVDLDGLAAGPRPPRGRLFPPRRCSSWWCGGCRGLRILRLLRGRRVLRRRLRVLRLPICVVPDDLRLRRRLVPTRRRRRGAVSNRRRQRALRHVLALSNALLVRPLRNQIFVQITLSSRLSLTARTLRDRRARLRVRVAGGGRGCSSSNRLPRICRYRHVIGLSVRNRHKIARRHLVLRLVERWSITALPTFAVLRVAFTGVFTWVEQYRRYLQKIFLVYPPVLKAFHMANLMGERWLLC